MKFFTTAFSAMREQISPFGVLIVLGLVLGLSVKACVVATHQAPAFPEGFPTREVVDTRKFKGIAFNDSLGLVIVDAFYQALPNEMGLCIYGSYDDGDIEIIGIKADSTSANPRKVDTFCVDNGPIIGWVHSHPLFRNPAYPCTPSQQDYLSLLVDNLALMVIYCANGSGVTVFRDGRWWIFAWR